MRKFCFLVFSLFYISLFAQVEFSKIESFLSKEANIYTYKIDTDIKQNENGAYGFCLKTPVEYTSFAIGWSAGSQNYPAGLFDIVYKTHKPNKAWSNFNFDDGSTMPNETKSGFYKTNLLFGIDEYYHDSLEFYIYPPEGEIISEIYLILLDISETNIDEIENINSKSGAKSCPEFPEIIPRSAWCNGVSACLNPTYTVVYRNPTHTVIHHGASPSSYTDGAAVVRSYWNYHVNSNGWSDIGYNYLFDKYGNFFLGRHNPNFPNQDVHAAHAGNSNPYSIGLNFLGDSDSPETAPTTPQLEKCEEFLAWWYDFREFDPLSSASIIKQSDGVASVLPRICGHRDVNPGGTTCPGNTLYALLSSIRTGTKQIIDNCNGNLDNIAPTTEIINARNWYNSDFELSFNDQDNPEGSGLNEAYYQIMDFDGNEWRANNDYGFFNDNFNENINNQWTQVSGTWSIYANSLKQSNEALTNPNIYALVEQNSNNAYLYHFKMKISGSGNNRRAGIFFFCSDPSASFRGEAYMIYFRLETNKVEIYKASAGSISDIIKQTSSPFVSEQWMDIKITYNPNNGNMNIFINDNHVLYWKDLNPLTTGTGISFRSGSCIVEYDDMKVYKNRNDNIKVLTGNENSKQIRFESPNSQQEAGRIRTIVIDNANNWSESVSKNIFTDFQIPTTDIEVNQEWQTQDFNAYFYDEDQLSGVEKGFFNISDFDGNKWTANKNNGHFFDDFNNGISQDWTNQVGNWTVNSGILQQNSETEGNSNIFAYLQQNLSNKYLYEFDLKIEGNNDNKRAGFHYFCNNSESENRGDGYFVWFRLKSQELEFYKVINDVFSLKKAVKINFEENTFYNIKVIYDRVSGETYVYQNNNLIGEYKDPEPYSAGTFISFRSGNSKMFVDNFRTFRSRYSNQNTIITCATSQSDVRYSNQSPESPAAKISSICMDSAKNISTVITKPFNIDFSKPSTISIVNDGLGQDLDISSETTSLSANWTESYDPNSGIDAYYYSIGKTPGGNELIDWTNIGHLTNFTLTNLELQIGQIYYVSVKSRNGAGLFSDLASSDGIIIQSVTCPENQNVCSNNEAYILEGALPIGGIYSGNGVIGGNFNPANANIGNNTITYYYNSQECSFEIFVNNPPQVYCPDNLIIEQNSSPFSLIGASPEGGNYFLNGTQITNINPANFAEGDYIITYGYTDQETLCYAECNFTLTISPSSKIEKFLKTDFEIYPNPNSGEFKTTLPNNNHQYNIKIFNIQSQIIEDLNYNINGDEIIFNLKNISPGLYFINFSNSDYNITKKIFIE